MRSSAPPSQAEFLAVAREAFAFLKAYGFAEVPAPEYRRRDPYQVWFQAAERFVIVQGEGWGTSASVSFETSDGRELSEIYFVPKAERPVGARSFGQLAEIRAAAARAARYAVEFLSGNLSTFNQLAHELPLYKRSPRDA